ncbi:glycosyltransferase [Schleiferiaceae bacterium]|nr:glycosyltransferase [Schleiferiaceae bacterium]
MRVLHLTHTDLRFDNRILKELKSISTLEGTKILGIGVLRDFDFGPRHNELGHYSIRNLRIFSVSMRKARVLKFILFFIEYFVTTVPLCLKYKPDIIHCHDTFVLPVGTLASRLLGAKLIYDAHELESNKYGQGVVLGKITLLIEKVCWGRVDKLITVSNGIKSWYIENIGYKEAQVIFNSPYNLQNKNGIEHYFNVKFGIPLSAKCFIFVGALEGGRRIEEILHIFSELDESYQVVFLGFGSLTDYIRKFSKAYSNIHYHEPVSHEQVINLIGGCYAGFCLIENVSLSDYLSMPNKFFEYINAKVPPIVFDFPDLANFVRAHNFGYVFNEKIQLKEQIESITKERQEGISLTFSWDVEEDKLLKLYKDL